MALPDKSLSETFPLNPLSPSITTERGRGLCVFGAVLGSSDLKIKLYWLRTQFSKCYGRCSEMLMQLLPINQCRKGQQAHNNPNENNY